MVDQTLLRKNRVQVVMLLVALPLVSVGAAYILFYLAGQETLLQSTNQGEFVQPPVEVAALRLEGPDGEMMTEGGTWWIWMVTEECEAACEETLFQLRQVHVLLNKDAGRVQRGLVAENAATYQRVSERFPALHFLRSANPAVLARGVYIVDPIGNVVLRYPPHTEPKPLLDDLKRLLKVSQIG